MAVLNRMNFATATPVLVAPRWAGDWLGREYLLPGGAKIDESAIAADSLGRKGVPGGTLLSRTFVQRAAGAPLHPAIAGEDEYFLLAFDVTDAVLDNDITVVRPMSGLVVKENFLPGFAGLSAGLKAVIRANWITTLGSE